MNKKVYMSKDNKLKVVLSSHYPLLRYYEIDTYRKVRFLWFEFFLSDEGYVYKGCDEDEVEEKAKECVRAYNKALKTSNKDGGKTND